jgi:hypothetical protein
MPIVLGLDNITSSMAFSNPFSVTLLNPVYRDVLAHYGTCVLPSRVNTPDRRGKVERGGGYANQTPLREQPSRRWRPRQPSRPLETTLANTRIHGTMKQQVAAMFAEEKPALPPSPVEPFRYQHFGERSIQLDGWVEDEAAYYSALPRR